MDPFQHILDEVEHYYSAKLSEHGPTPRGVDWKSQESQDLRFEQLAKILDREPENSSASILDYGCGFGSFLRYNQEHAPARRLAYTGYDISTTMLAEGRRKFAGEGAKFVNQLAEDDAFDYCIASGIFNVKQDQPVDVWESYMWNTLLELHRRSQRGFAFNALTAYSDADRQESRLYYADPLQIFDRVKRRLSKFVTLLHDYPLYEFTLLVRKELP